MTKPASLRRDQKGYDRTKLVQQRSTRPKVCAYFGSGFCFFVAITKVVSALMTLPELVDSGKELFEGILVGYLAWWFCYAAVFSKNPFKVDPFTWTQVPTTD